MSAEVGQPDFSPSEIARSDLVENSLKHLLDGHGRGIQLNRIDSRLQRGYRTLGIALIAQTYLVEKTRKTNTVILCLQLKIAPARTFFGTCGQKNLERRRRENHRPHVATVRYQARRLQERPLTLQQRFAYRRQRGDQGRAGADLFMFSSDYPHPEGTNDPIGRFERTMGALTDDARTAFYSKNFEQMMQIAA